jgi:hypothetical protein
LEIPFSLTSINRKIGIAKLLKATSRPKKQNPSNSQNKQKYSRYLYKQDLPIICTWCWE